MTLPDAINLATTIAYREVTAEATVAASLARIAAHNPELNCFTQVMADEAIAAAQNIDQAIAAGQDPGPLAGVPFAVKNLFDVAGLTTLAGSKINQDNPPAPQDATAIARLRQAGAILVGTLNMDEYAYGFVTENAHYGPTHNPHDPSRIAGGSSGGAAAAVAAGLVPLALGSDTNGSVRVPAAFCGVYGLKPTYGRLSRAGTALFSSSLDCIGLFTRSVRDAAIAFDVLQGPDPRDPICSHRAPELTLTALLEPMHDLKVAIADDYFLQGMEPPVSQALERVAQALNVKQYVTLPEAHRAKAAAYLITACEGSNLHLAHLQTRPQDFDPATRDRFLAGAMIPAAWYLQAQRFRRWYRDRLREVFQTVDVILAPTVPCVAPPIGQATMTLNGQEVLVRPNLGVYTQPISFVGLPVLSVPLCRAGELPVGLQLIAAPYQEAKLLQVAAALEAQGILNASCAEPRYGEEEACSSAQ